MAAACSEKELLAEAHSAETYDLIRRFPGLADAVVKDIRQGIRKFHDGFYGADFGVSQQKLAKDIYAQYCLDRPDSFWGYIDNFHKFTVVVGPMAYAGSLPYFSYKVAYPQQWSFKDQVAWITVFFTLKDPDIARVNMALEPRILSDRGVGISGLPISTEQNCDYLTACRSLTGLTSCTAPWVPNESPSAPPTHMTIFCHGSSESSAFTLRNLVPGFQLRGMR